MAKLSGSHHGGQKQRQRQEGARDKALFQRKPPSDLLLQPGLNSQHFQSPPKDTIKYRFHQWINPFIRSEPLCPSHFSKSLPGNVVSTGDPAFSSDTPVLFTITICLDSTGRCWSLYHCSISLFSLICAFLCHIFYFIYMFQFYIPRLTFTEGDNSVLTAHILICATTTISQATVQF